MSENTHNLNLESKVKKISKFVRVIQEQPEPFTLASTLALDLFNVFECRGVIIGLIQHEGSLTLIGTYGFADEHVEPFKTIPLWSPLPITDAVRTSNPIILGSVEELVRKYPNYPNPMMEEKIAITSLPIFFRSSVIGGVGFTSIQPPDNSYINDSITELMLGLCGIYLNNYQQQINKHLSLENENSINNLSIRQLDVISLMKDNLTTEQIASKLKFSPSTIKHEILKIYNVLHVNSREKVLEVIKRIDLEI